MSETFFSRVYPYAKKAGNRISVAPSVIMAQWAVESAFGNSELAKNANNLGGIKKTGSSIASGSYTIGKQVYARYSSLDQFVEDYVRVMSLSYYQKVRDKADVDIPGQTSALGQSPYAGSQYKDKTGKVGGSILGVIQQFGLGKYDANGSLPAASIEGLSAEEIKKLAIVGASVIALIAVLK